MGTLSPLPWATPLQPIWWVHPNPNPNLHSNLDRRWAETDIFFRTVAPRPPPPGGAGWLVLAPFLPARVPPGFCARGLLSSQHAGVPPHPHLTLRLAGINYGKKYFSGADYGLLVYISMCTSICSVLLFPHPEGYFFVRDSVPDISRS